jgi:hypothetical protein
MRVIVRRRDLQRGGGGSITSLAARWRRLHLLAPRRRMLRLRLQREKVEVEPQRASERERARERERHTQRKPRERTC